ncbi:hypothetical protein [uncultured Stenotrophomonas sp.]|uniref:hypothetical protein n=1 Tax=uncultured Stenotrophomonas sp. TaxID=165438 RepID=UPI002583AA88|nr:hypothetical protein [uncultured Stenotrophomonas sp.]
MSQGENQLADSAAGNDGSDEAALSLLAGMREREEEEAQGGDPAGDDQAEQEREDEGAAEGEDAQPEQEEQPEPEFEVKVDGKTLKVKQSDLISGYQMQADYQQKTAKLAEQRREVEARDQAIQQERSRYANQLDVLIEATHRQLVGDSAALQELIETDPQAYLREQAKLQSRAQQLDQLMQQRQALAGQQSAEEQRQHQEWVKAEREALRVALPEWADEKKATAEQQQIAEYLLERGYSADELQTLQDHRALLIARDAAKYRALQKAQAKQARQEPPKTIKPGAQVDPKQTNKQRDVQDALKAARKGQGDDDWMRYLRQTRK